MDTTPEQLDDLKYDAEQAVRAYIEAYAAANPKEPSVYRPVDESFVGRPGDVLVHREISFAIERGGLPLGPYLAEATAALLNFPWGTLTESFTIYSLSLVLVRHPSRPVTEEVA